MQVVRCPVKGRGPQLNHGAAAARKDADVRPATTSALTKPQPVHSDCHTDAAVPPCRQCAPQWLCSARYPCYAAGTLGLLCIHPVAGVKLLA